MVLHNISQNKSTKVTLINSDSNARFAKLSQLCSPQDSCPWRNEKAKKYIFLKNRGLNTIPVAPLVVKLLHPRAHIGKDSIQIPHLQQRFKVLKRGSRSAPVSNAWRWTWLGGLHRCKISLSLISRAIVEITSLTAFPVGRYKMVKARDYRALFSPSSLLTYSVDGAIQIEQLSEQ
jgi:hypothetical protein